MYYGFKILYKQQLETRKTKIYTTFFVDLLKEFLKRDRYHSNKLVLSIKYGFFIKNFEGPTQK